ncbi:MFS general substrate transporter [Sistotremastrum suecicum HHB10207 ss-3]|uniref:MFS general substrate transporter n=1 Tax=Sistotremastrum suecicum HHB10207 ss-3 TaxID=1314776 RepID=A0A166C941_9AGAM|nr:MFS general substrate transporter [Sistotremastrum suecicum HHB10207 ss-3]
MNLRKDDTAEKHISSDDVAVYTNPAPTSHAHSQAHHRRDLEREGELMGYMLDVGASRSSEGEKRETEKDNSSATHSEELKLAKDGHTVLIPQPSADPNDPLNWSTTKKYVILIVVTATAFLPDYGSATGGVLLFQQSTLWHKTPDVINHSHVGNSFMLGAGGMFVIVFSAYFGRLPVLFWFTLIGFATAIGCASAPSFPSFMAFRILNGFFSTVAQAGGLMFIKDLFFFHEHARMINIWDASIILSPYFGPFVASFVTSKTSWRWVFWMYTMMTGLCLLGIMFVVEETYYDRSLAQEDQPPRGRRIERVVGIAQWRTRTMRNTFYDAITRPVQAILKPVIAICTVYYLTTFAWVVGINTTLSIFVKPLYSFGQVQLGAFYTTPIVAAILGQIVGHFLHDALATHYLRHHDGKFEPEARFRAIWISQPFMIAGLVILGFALQKDWHFMVTAVAWGMYVFGIMVTTVALQAYMLDSYPEGSGEVAAWLSFARTTGGFIVSYFQVRWATNLGAASSFGTQAAICAFAFLLIVLLQWKGKAMRMSSGPLNFKTD